MKEQSPKAEAKSLGWFIFFTVVASSLNHSFDRGGQTSEKGQMLNIFGFVSHVVSAVTTQPL